MTKAIHNYHEASPVVGKIRHSYKSDGTLRKLMDVDRLSRLGWTASISLEEGIRSTYEWFLTQSVRKLRAR